ncbi:imidazolonepropionase [Sunxiuqinia elliptica]|uniref:Imidazolonepropionase n=2 Tax=Sunxiuqinia elliptica TaxID=655355 RepID=A0A4R6GSM8_9BACT|nr:imidazolonepropionase [Sunxiuqinia elliptica]TDO55838.1 imidazolonepropionase [Sunxiuqinia elliptica]
MTMKILLENIRQLVQVEDEARTWVAGKEMGSLRVLEDAFLVIDDDQIETFGPMKDFNENLVEGADMVMEIDCAGKIVMPGYCDSHTHVVFPASREQEFVDRINGLTYEEIARRGGGILNSAKRMEQRSEDELFADAMVRLDEVKRMGTTAIEIKSGYGLSMESELKMLRVIKRLKANSPMIIKSTFLGAHALPVEYKADRQKYIKLLIEEMLPEIDREGLADYMDVFCDQGFFTVEETAQLLEAGWKYDLQPKIHANELGLTGGVQVGVKHQALSVDHLEHIGDDEIKALLASKTMPTVLPGAAFFLGMPLSPIREMIEAGLPIALASDYNPGSSPSGNMNFIQSLACIKYKMTPEEAINACTINSAYAMGVEKIAGTICPGKQANLFITRELPTYSAIPYYFGANPVETVIINGEIY